MTSKIILYDITSKLTPAAWSPNVWKTRYILNYKRIPYETKWYSYPEIKGLWQELGLSPLHDGKGFGPVATLPVISIPSSNGGPPTVVADSVNIALHLEKEYPDSPRLFPQGTYALQIAFCQHIPTLFIGPFRPLLLPTTLQRLDDAGSQYFERTRKEWYGISLDQLTPEKRKDDIQKLQKAFNSLYDILKANRAENENGPDPEWVMGSVGPTYADFVLGSFLIWFKLMADAELWNMVSAWNGGKWGKFMEQLQPWSQADQ